MKRRWLVVALLVGAFLWTCSGPEYSEVKVKQEADRWLIVDNQTGGPIGVYLHPGSGRIGTAHPGEHRLRLRTISPSQRGFYFRVMGDQNLYPSAQELISNQSCWWVEATHYNYERDFLLSLVPCSFKGKGGGGLGRQKN